MNAYEIDTRHWLAAHSARLAVQGKTKRVADALGYKGPRSMQRAQNERDCKGSAMDRALEFIRASENPFALIAAMNAEAVRASFEGIPTVTLIARYRVLLGLDAETEGRGHALMVCRETTWDGRAEHTLEDLTHDAALLALELEFKARRVPVREVMG